jgi:G3E family GTPase
MKRIVYTVAVALLVPTLSFAQLNLQNAATITLTKTEAITVKQLRNEVARIEEQAKRTLSAAERRQVLDVMINTRLAVQALSGTSWRSTENEVNQQLQQARDAMKAKLGRDPTDKEFEDAVKAETGMSFAEFKDDMRRQMTVQKYLMNKKRPLFESIKPTTEAEIVSTCTNSPRRAWSGPTPFAFP